MNFLGFYIPRHYFLFAGLGFGIVFTLIFADRDISESPPAPPAYYPMERLSGNNIGWYRDKDTGCEYFGYFNGGIVPRMNNDGKQVCTNIQKGPDFEIH